MWQAKQEALDQEASRTSLAILSASSPNLTDPASAGASGGQPQAPLSPRVSPGLGINPPPQGRAADSQSAPSGDDQREQEVDAAGSRTGQAATGVPGAGMPGGRAPEELTELESRTVWARAAAEEHRRQYS